MRWDDFVRFLSNKFHNTYIVSGITNRTVEHLSQMQVDDFKQKRAKPSKRLDDPAWMHDGTLERTTDPHELLTIAQAALKARQGQK